MTSICAAGSLPRNMTYRFLLTVFLTIFVATVHLTVQAADSRPALDSPDNPRGEIVNQSSIKWSWDWVPGAVSYEVMVDGAIQGSTNSENFNSQDLSVGEHTMTVMAIAASGRRSAASNTASVTISAASDAAQASTTARAGTASARAVARSSGSGPYLPAPPNPRGTVTGAGSITWSWDRVPGAIFYSVWVDGIAKGLTPEPFYNSNQLWAGDHNLAVKTVAPGNHYSGSYANARVSLSAGSNQAPQNDSTNTRNINLLPPQNVRGTVVSDSSILWQWDPVPDAVFYEVNMDGNTIGLIPEPQYTGNNLWQGDHAVIVKSVGPNGEYSAPSQMAQLILGPSGGSLPAPAPPPQPDPAPEPAPAPSPTADQGLIDPISWTINDVYLKPGYELTFSDEFNGNQLNPARWNTRLRWDGEFNGAMMAYWVVNGEDQFYVNNFTHDPEHRDLVLPQYNPFQFDGNRLAIRAVRNPLKQWDAYKGYGSLKEIVSQQNFLSGAIGSFDKFTQKYGYFEARIKIPSHVGTFPAFWLHHQKKKTEDTQRTEIDIMENLGHAPWWIYNAFHYYTNVSGTYGGEPHAVKPLPESQIYTGVDYSEDYHVYAVEWSPGYIAWFIDGEKVSEIWNHNVDYEELYIIINMAMGGDWTNYPTNAGGLGRPNWDHFPNAADIASFANPALEIDWVRAYKKR